MQAVKQQQLVVWFFHLELDYRGKGQAGLQVYVGINLSQVV
jgi:hypothetical protein